MNVFMQCDVEGRGAQFSATAELLYARATGK